MTGIRVTAIAVLAATLALGACGSDGKKGVSSGGTVTTTAPTTLGTAPPITADPAKSRAGLQTSEGTIVIALDFVNAPKAAGNFATLVGKGFYDGLTFHRAAKDFVIQGGDPKGDGTGGPGYVIQGEVPKTGYKLGSVAMAKTAADPPGTSGSQFFIITGVNGTQLPADYALVGQVTGGLDVAQKIESYAPTTEPFDGTPTKKVTITKATLSTP
ncbi:MAG: peptidylprolyl isomerase [Acidimicrobiia bacterium]